MEPCAALPKKHYEGNGVKLHEIALASSSWASLKTSARSLQWKGR